MSRVQPIEAAIKDMHLWVLQFRKNRPLLFLSDYQNPQQLIKWALSELNEFIDAWTLINSGTATLERLLHALDEMYDVKVLVSSFAWVVIPTLDFTSHIGRMNGRGGRSDFIEQLQCLIQEAGENPKEIPWVVALIQSAVHHSIIIDSDDALPYVDLTKRKVIKNRPVDGYESYDVLTGERLAELEQAEKRVFTETFYRKLRDVFGSPLKSYEAKLFQRHLLFWRRGEEQMELLDAELERHAKNNPVRQNHEVIVF